MKRKTTVPKKASNLKIARPEAIEISKEVSSGIKEYFGNADTAQKEFNELQEQMQKAQARMNELAGVTQSNRSAGIGMIRTVLLTAGHSNMEEWSYDSEKDQLVRK